MFGAGENEVRQTELADPAQSLELRRPQDFNNYALASPELHQPVHTVLYALYGAAEHRSL